MPASRKPIARRLLDRDSFRAGVLKRDGCCVICGRKEGEGWRLDAHHIVERRLFIHPEEVGGYFLSNGATLCDNGSMESCHLKAEATLISCEEIREKAGIEEIALPMDLYSDQRYDKWGNPYLSNGQRAKGPLFMDESVQAVLRAGDALLGFTDWVKHPRTSHLPWSEGATEDDEFMPNIDRFRGAQIVLSAKLDGEQTTCYTDYLHARAVDGRHSDAQNWVRNFHASWGWQIPKGWRVCGENMFETHTIKYRLPTYFFAHSVWNDRNECLSWDETLEWCSLLGLTVVPVLYRGLWDEKLARGIYRRELDGNPLEGFVARIAAKFALAEFPVCVGKFVAKEFAGLRDARHGDRSRERNFLVDSS